MYVHVDCNATRSANAEKRCFDWQIPDALFELARFVGSRAATALTTAVTEGSNPGGAYSAVFPVPIVTSAREEKPLARAHSGQAAHIGPSRTRRFARVSTLIAGEKETFACLHSKQAAPAAVARRETFLLLGVAVVVLC